MKWVCGECTCKMPSGAFDARQVHLAPEYPSDRQNNLKAYARWTEECSEKGRKVPICLKCSAGTNNDTLLEATLRYLEEKGEPLLSALTGHIYELPGGEAAKKSIKAAGGAKTWAHSIGLETLLVGTTTLVRKPPSTNWPSHGPSPTVENSKRSSAQVPFEDSRVIRLQGRRGAFLDGDIFVPIEVPSPPLTIAASGCSL